MVCNIFVQDRSERCYFIIFLTLGTPLMSVMFEVQRMQSIAASSHSNSLILICLLTTPSHKIDIEFRSLGHSCFRMDFFSPLGQCCNPFWSFFWCCYSVCHVSLCVVAEWNSFDRWLTLATFIVVWYQMPKTMNSALIAEPSTLTRLFVTQCMKQR